MKKYYLVTSMELRTEVVLQVVVDLFIGSEQWRRGSQLLDMLVTLADDAADLSDDVLVKLDEVDSSRLDVGVVQVLSVRVQRLEVLVLQVHHHHLLVEVLHGEAELEQVDASVLLEILEEGVEKISVLEYC